MDRDLKKVHPSCTVANSAFIGGLLALKLLPVRSPPPVFALLVMMFGLTDAACDGNYCCYNSDCATSWCQSGGGFNCKCEEEWFKDRYGTGSCRSKISDGRRAHHSGLGNTPDYDSCVARDGTCAAYPTLSHRSVRLHHPHFILSCPGVVSADEGKSQTAIRVAIIRTANQAGATALSH